MVLDSSTLLLVSSFLEIGFILIFILIAFGLLLAGITGYRRGVFKSTYKLIGLGCFLALALLTVKPLMNVIYNFDISGFVQSPILVSLNLGTKTIDISANVTTVEATLTDFITSFCNQINGSQYVADVSQFVKTLVTSILALVIYLLDLILIAILGNGFLEFFWFVCFRKSAPKIAKRLGKIKFVGMIETMVTYMVLLFLFISPLTSLTNSIAQGVKKSNAKDSQNENVQEIIKMVDIYNDSLFARTLFNWNPDLNDGGLTFDTYILDYFAKTANDGIDSISISQEITSLIKSVGDIAASLGASAEEGALPSLSLSDELIGSIMGAFTSSDFFTGLVEIGFQLALSTDVLSYIIPNGEYFEPVDLTDVTLEGELEVFENMAKDILDSGIIDDFVDLETYQLKPMTDMVTYLDDLFTLESNRGKLDKLLNVFNRIDEFNLLSNAFTSVVFWATSLDENYTLLKYLGGDITIEKPYSDTTNANLVKNFVSDIHIGNEIHMVFDALWGLADCGEHMIKNTYNAFAAEDETVKSEAKTALINTLTDHSTMVKFRECITGSAHTANDGTISERNAENGQHYALMDSNILTKFINTSSYFKNFFDNVDLTGVLGDSLETSKARWSTLMSSVYADSATVKPIKFFKNEVESILTVVTNIAELKHTTPVPDPSPSIMYRAYGEGEEETSGEEASTPFIYKEYGSFLEAAINLFDGWINPDDVVGSILDLDSQIASYLSEAFECLEPLDDSQVVYAIGVPILSGKVAGIKESAQNYFDVDIMVEQINNSNNVFEQLSDFMSPTLISVLQHFYRGFLMNDEGKFDVGALTSQLSDDIGGFLNKLNEKIVVTQDDPNTLVDETVYDTHELKYYLTELLKHFYNFELFNPQTGPNANKNMQNLLNVVFGFMEPFGIEKPSSATYAALEGATLAETKAKWEAELGGICNLFAVIGKNRMLKFADYASNISTALLYSLAGDTTKAAELDPDNAANMPMNLGEVLATVGDSYLFSTRMGGLLDQYLDGTICDVELGVEFENIVTQEGWVSEGNTMNELLGTIAKLDLELENLDFTKISDFVGLNEMLHSLSDSLIFKANVETSPGVFTYENKFGAWLFKKVGTAMDSMSGGLLDDPTAEDWDSSWETVLGDYYDSTSTQNIAKYDFYVRNGYEPTDFVNNKLGWSCAEYDTKITAYKTTMAYSEKTNAEITSYFEDSTNLDNYYNDVLQYDEIGRLINVIARGKSIIGGGSGIDFGTISASNLDSLLTAINNSDCLRIASYNAMNLAKSSIGSNSFVDISLASFDYMITAGVDLTNYTGGRTNRQTEIDHIVNFYSSYKDLQGITGDSLDSSAFFDKAKLCQILGILPNGSNDPDGTDILSNLLAELHNTQCFNLAVASNPTRNPDDLSFFEDMMVNLMKESGLTDLSDSNDSIMTSRAVKISNHEIDGTTNTDGYNSSWVEYDSGNTLVGGEVTSFTGVLKSVVAVSDGSTIEADSLSITALEASKVKNVMKSVNGSFLCTGVMKHFINSAFEHGGLNLKPLLQFESNTEIVADFDLTYLDYGGADNSCTVGTEIYNLETVLGSMQYDDGMGNLQFVELDDLSAGLSHKPDFLDGVFYYLYNSKVLAKTETYNSTSIKGRSLLLYNTIKDGFGSYLIGSDAAAKVDGLEKIFTLTNADPNNYLVEADGIAKIIDAAGNEITGVSVDSLRTDPTKKAMILNVIQYTYDRGSETIDKQRAYVASEIVAGIFDSVIDTEYGTIATNYTPSEIATFDDYEKFYFASNSTGGKAVSANDISLTTFDNLNEVEKIGLDGMISMTEYINGDADRTGASVADIGTNPFVLALTTNSSTIRSIFTTKLHNNGQDSRMAKVLYISRGAQTVVKETTTADDANPANSGLLVLLKYVENLPTHPGTNPSDYIWTVGFTDDYYDASFAFDTYGNALMDYVDSCTTSA